MSAARGVILGGGIAGLALAAALQRSGRDTVVLEARPSQPTQGSGLILGPTAMRALDQLGLRQAVIAAGQVLRTGGLTDLSLRPLGHDVFGHFSALAGEPFVGIERSALMSLLAALVACRFGARYVGIAQTADGVVVNLDGGETLTAQWAVLADGIRSHGRDVIAPAVIRDAGQWCWRGVAEGVDLGAYREAFLEGWGSTWRFGLTPIGNGRTYWFVVQRAATRMAREHVPLRDRQAFLLSAAEAFPALVRRLIAATPTAAILENRLADLAPLARWHRGRVACIGDAAHAMTPNLGQGATQAIEDAVVLAALLDAGPEAAFARYAAIRQRHAEQTVREARLIGRIAHAPRALVPLRDALLSRLPRALSIRRLAWLYEDRSELVRR